MKLIFDYKFRFYTSKMHEICLHCHWLYFSSIIMSFGQGDIYWMFVIHGLTDNDFWTGKKSKMLFLNMADKNASFVTKNLGLGVIHSRGVQAIFYCASVLCG